MPIIHGIDMPNFTEDEFPEGELAHTSFHLLARLQMFREKLGVAVHPSKVKGALARYDGPRTSDHFVKVGEIASTGIDVFCDCSIFKAWTVAISCGLWDSVGVYFDTRDNNGVDHPMLHLGLRKKRAIWLRDNHVYVSPGGDKLFYDKLMCLFADQSSIGK